MKLIEVFRYELEHRLRTPSTWVYAVLLFAFAVGNGVDVGTVGTVNANAPKELAYNAVIVGMFGLLVSAALFGDAALRDIEAGMDPLLFTSPLRKIDHLGGRYLAALVTNAILLLAVPLGFAVPTLIGYPDPAAFGPLRIAALLQPWLIFLLPNMVLTGAVLFTVAALSRRLVPVYLSGFVLFIGVLALSDLGVLDAVGLSTLKAMTLNWTASELNSRLVGFSTGLLRNRLLWLAVTGVVLALLHQRFRFEHANRGGVLRDRPDASESARTVPLRATRVTTSFGSRTTVRQILAIARNSLVEVAGNVWFAGVLILCMGWSASLLQRIPGGPLDMSQWPVTMMVTTALSRDFLVGLYVLVCLYAGEVVWKDRDVGVSEIADAAPVGDGTVIAGRFLGLVAMAAMWTAASMVGGILGQLGQGYSDVEPTLYLRVLFGMNLADIALVTVLVLTIHVVMNHKYLGLAAALMALVIPFAGAMLPHYLLTYAGDPIWADTAISFTPPYSSMNGFGPFLAPFMWFKLYSAGWALLLAVAASLLWVRGRESGARSRLRQARARFAGQLRQTVGVALVLIVAIGGFIFYNTNVLNASGADDEPGALQAEYDARYSRFESAPQPMIERARLRVEIYPDDAAVDLSGSFRLVNKTGVPIDSIHLSTNPRIATRAISFDRPATPVMTDTAVGYRIYALARPLAPGDSIELSFDLAFRQRGFPNSGMQTDVVENGTHFGRDWLPFVGYRAARERNGESVRVETIVGTAADQTAIAPGVLRREWVETGRRYFHYEMESPLPFHFAVFSARYAMLTDRWNPPAGAEQAVTLGVYYHPDHDRNLDTFIRSMKASLSYNTAHFGPYGSTVLRIVEIPRYRRVARAQPNMVAFSEHAFFARTDVPPIDQLFVGTAHQIAHHWWGGAHDAGDSRGFLSEMLANYSAMMVAEKEFGPEAARRLYAFYLDDYFTARATASDEVSILDVEDRPYPRKGILAMYLMREYIGEDALNTALRNIIDRHRGALSAPTVRDVVAELRAVTPDSLQYLLTDLFETVTVWDVKTERASMEPTATGEYRVMLDVVAKKIRVDSTGKQFEAPMDDSIEIGVFATGNGTALGDPLYLERHRILSGKQTISITVPKKPARAGIDPYRKLIERIGRDNVKPIASVGAGPTASTVARF